MLWGDGFVAIADFFPSEAVVLNVVDGFQEEVAKEGGAQEAHKGGEAKEEEDGEQEGTLDEVVGDHLVVEGEEAVAIAP